jgi:hypothetical protein
MRWNRLELMPFCDPQIRWKCLTLRQGSSPPKRRGKGRRSSSRSPWTFTHPEGDALALSVSGLPSWLSFDPLAGIFPGTPPAGLAKGDL